jgi:ribose transport system substrate-binding protein
MRRKFAWGASLAAVAMVLSACGGSSDSTEATAEETAAAVEEAPAEEAPAEEEAAAGAATVVFESRESSIPVGYDQPEAGELSLAYLNPVGGNEFLDTLGESMTVAAEQLGGTVTVLDGKGSVDEQVSQLDQLVAQGVDGIFVFALDPNAMKPALAKAKEAGIALISIDENFVDDNIGDYDSQILQRRDEAAFLGAGQMASLVPAGATIGTIDFAIAVPSIVFSIEQAKVWATAFGLNVAGNASNQSDDIAGGEVAGTELLANYPDLAGVIAYNDPSAVGASAAARAQGKEGLAFGGQNGGSDGLEAVRGGRINYTIQLDAPSIGKFAAWGLYNVAQGKEVPKTVKAGDPKLVTTENAAEAKSWADQIAEMVAAG